MSKTFAPTPHTTGIQRNAQIQSPKRSFKASRRGGGPKSNGPSFRNVLKATAKSISKGDKALDKTLRQLKRGGGGNMDPHKLLAVQVEMYRRMEQLEFFGRATDKATTALRTTLQSQQ